MYPSHISVQLSWQYTEYHDVTNTQHSDNTLSNIAHHSSIYRHKYFFTAKTNDAIVDRYQMISLDIRDRSVHIRR